MLVKQIKNKGDNFSYLIWDKTSVEAAIIDPSFNADIIVQSVKDGKFAARYIINTHHHGDHVAGNEQVKRTLESRIVAHELAPIKKDITVKDGSTLRLGEVGINVIHTPGHTPDGICLLAENKLFTGDTLFVGECGRTDLPGGSSEAMYHSLFDKLMKLPDNTEIYPGHDYGSKAVSTIGIERETNYTLARRTLEEFVQFMSET